MKLYIASANPNKISEIEEIFTKEGVGNWVELTPRPEFVADVVEDAPDLIGNARLKAIAICEATRGWAVADDTGLEVDALGGLPGVRSARYVGDDCDDDANVAKLLGALAASGAVEQHQRRARFRTVALVVGPDGSELCAQGTVDGVIAETRHGDGGFGYDPVFIPDDGDGRTFAEMSPQEKNAISHRGRAFRELVTLLGAIAT